MTDFLKILHDYWGYNNFRGIQEEIITSIGQGRDTLGLMPTGGGKSITFQVPALAQPGVCLVITPLIALMKDQVNRLHSMNIKAAAIYSGMTHQDIIQTLENCIFGDYKFLYISPERLKSELFLAKLRRIQVSFITVDEAHCISQWGYDFRPSYLEIRNIRARLPHCPVLALTATATPKVVKDIQHQLGFAKPNVFKMSFERSNLAYIVRHAEDKAQELLNTLRSTKGSAIVYTRNRNKSRDISQWLNQNGITALYYHAGLENNDKDERQHFWQNGSVRVIVATNAFGMGIDKADVRLVVHMDVPDSIEAYFQEAGRAGRDGKEAEAILIYNGNDRTKILKRINETFPSKEYIHKVYNDIASFFQMAVGDGYNITREFNEHKFCTLFKHFPVQLESALKILTRAGYINFRNQEENHSQLMLMLQKEELYKLNHLSPNNELVLQTILRHYGGIFSQYVPIEERSIAEQTNLPPQTVYETLQNLNEQYILHYIPRKDIPHITYTTRRVDDKQLNIPKEVYEDRKKEYEARISYILQYAENTISCRSSLLLEYFGETHTKKCGKCDICQAHKNPQAITQNIENAAEAIISILSDGEKHPIEEIHQLPFSIDIIAQAIEWLVHEDEVMCKNSKVFLT